MVTLRNSYVKGIIPIPFRENKLLNATFNDTLNSLKKQPPIFKFTLGVI